MARKAIFDAIRSILGRGFRQSEVDAIDRALDQTFDQAENLALDRVPCVPSHQVSDVGIALIKRFEGCARLRPDGLVESYPDPGSGDAPWTIGWGATGPDIGPGTVWTQAQCDARLAQDIARHAAEVAAVLGNAPTTQAQFDALVSFHYNTGEISRATLTARHLAGDSHCAMEQFARWNRAGGRVLKGLARRRQAEAQVYASG